MNDRERAASHLLDCGWTLDRVAALLLPGTLLDSSAEFEPVEHLRITPSYLTDGRILTNREAQERDVTRQTQSWQTSG